MHEQQTITILKALSDPTRLDIVRRVLLEKSGASCGKVRECSPLSQPAMSHHFGKLVEAQILVERKNGKEKFYELNLPLLDRHGVDVTKL